MQGASLLDMAILGLLAVAIFYGWMVSRRLERLRGALLAFGPALEAFSAAVDRSERSVQDLRAESGRIASPPPAADDRERLIGAFADVLRRRAR